jgi:hypothetical protein
MVIDRANVPRYEAVFHQLLPRLKNRHWALVADE